MGGLTLHGMQMSPDQPRVSYLHLKLFVADFFFPPVQPFCTGILKAEPGTCKRPAWALAVYFLEGADSNAHTCTATSIHTGSEPLLYPYKSLLSIFPNTGESVYLFLS